MFRKLLLLALIAFSISGCAGVLNPYSENFQCPVMEEGKCVPIRQAYEESINQPRYITLEEGKESKKPISSQLENEYSDALLEKLTRLIKDPKTPILAPPKIARVMILPYQDETGRELYSVRYVYLIVEDPRWILQNIKTLPSEERE